MLPEAVAAEVPHLQQAKRPNAEARPVMFFDDKTVAWVSRAAQSRFAWPACFAARGGSRAPVAC